MDSRREIFGHEEKLWVLCLGNEDRTRRFSPLIDLIDWYNNQLLAKSILEKRVTFEAGQAAILATNGLLPVERLVIFGMGDTKNAGPAEGKKLCQDLGRVLEDLKSPPPWIVLSGHSTEKTIEEIKKSRTSVPILARANISVG